MVHATLGIPAPTRDDRRDGPGGVRLPPGRGAGRAAFACLGRRVQPAASACPRVAGRPRGARLPPASGAAGGARGSRIQPEARRIGATPKLVSGLIAVLQTQNPLGVVRWQVTRGRLALFAQVVWWRVTLGPFALLARVRLAADYARLVRLRIARIGRRSTARMPATVILSPRSPGAAHGSRKRLGRSWILWRAIGGRTQRVYTDLGIFTRRLP
jgi:hypothetical protein